LHYYLIILIWYCNTCWKRRKWKWREHKSR